MALKAPFIYKKTAFFNTYFKSAAIPSLTELGQQIIYQWKFWFSGFQNRFQNENNLIGWPVAALQTQVVKW